jgi:hypothetical protein
MRIPLFVAGLTLSCLALPPQGASAQQARALQASSAQGAKQKPTQGAKTTLPENPFEKFPRAPHRREACGGSQGETSANCARLVRESTGVQRDLHRLKLAYWLRGQGEVQEALSLLIEIDPKSVEAVAATPADAQRARQKFLDLRVEVARELARLTHTASPRASDGGSGSTQAGTREDPLAMWLGLLDDSPDDGKCQEAIRQLQSLGSLAVPSLLAKLEHFGPFGKRNAMQILALRPSDELYARIERYLLGQDAALAVVAAEVLAQLPKKPSLRLAGLAANSKIPEVILASVEARVRHGAQIEEAMRDLEGLLENAGPALRERAMDTVLQDAPALVDSDAAFQLVLRMAQSGDEHLKSAATNAISSYSAEGHEADLMALFESLQGLGYRRQLVSGLLSSAWNDDRFLLPGFFSRVLEWDVATKLCPQVRSFAWEHLDKISVPDLGLLWRLGINHGAIREELLRRNTAESLRLAMRLDANRLPWESFLHLCSKHDEALLAEAIAVLLGQDNISLAAVQIVAEHVRKNPGLASNSRLVAFLAAQQNGRYNFHVKGSGSQSIYVANIAIADVLEGRAEPSDLVLLAQLVEIPSSRDPLLKERYIRLVNATLRKADRAPLHVAREDYVGRVEASCERLFWQLYCAKSTIANAPELEDALDELLTLDLSDKSNEMRGGLRRADRLPMLLERLVELSAADDDLRGRMQRRVARMLSSTSLVQDCVWQYVLEPGELGLDFVRRAMLGWLDLDSGQTALRRLLQSRIALSTPHLRKSLLNRILQLRAADPELGLFDLEVDRLYAALSRSELEEVVREILEEKPDLGDVSANLIQRLAAFGDPELLPLYGRALELPGRKARECAVRAMTLTWSPKAVPLLLTARRNSDLDVRTLASQQLAELAAYFDEVERYQKRFGLGGDGK